MSRAHEFSIFYMFVTVQASGRYRDKFQTFGTAKVVISANLSHIFQPQHSENSTGFIVQRKPRLFSNAPEDPVHRESHTPLLGCSGKLRQIL